VLPPFYIFENFKISHFYVSRNYEVKYIDRYIQEERTQKGPVKKYFILLEIQKRQISDKKIYCCTIILLLFALKNLSFLYFPKYNVFFNGTFLHILLSYISFYIFNLVIFGDIKI
jgi:hypothetical protein